jgi:hypothetical protein
VRVPDRIDASYNLVDTMGRVYTVTRRGFGVPWSCRPRDEEQRTCPVSIHRVAAELQQQDEERFLAKMGGRIIYSRSSERLVIDKWGRCYAALPDMPMVRCPGPRSPGVYRRV